MNVDDGRLRSSALQKRSVGRTNPLNVWQFIGECFPYQGLEDSGDRQAGRVREGELLVAEVQVLPRQGSVHTADGERSVEDGGGKAAVALVHGEGRSCRTKEKCKSGQTCQDPIRRRQFGNGISRKFCLIVVTIRFRFGEPKKQLILVLMSEGGRRNLHSVARFEGRTLQSKKSSEKARCDSRSDDDIDTDDGMQTA